MGLCFLIQWVYALYLYNHNYQEFHDSVIVFSLPVTGVLQSLTAIYTFTFLPRKQKDPGYFGDLTILSYQFIQENIFYELLTLYGWVYFNSRFFPFLKKTFVFEFIWVFYPYYIRDFFPQTRIRDSYIDKGKTDKNRNFYFFATRITKIFYIWGKHYISFFFNYVRYLDLLNEKDIEIFYNMMLAATFATTCSIFLHTLKFKGYMGPVKAFLIYQASYLFTFYAIIQLAYIYTQNLDLCIIVLGGIFVNLGSRKIQFIYQALVFILLFSKRHGYIDSIMFVFNK